LAGTEKTYGNCLGLQYAIEIYHLTGSGIRGSPVNGYGVRQPMQRP